MDVILLSLFSLDEFSALSLTTFLVQIHTISRDKHLSCYASIHNPSRPVIPLYLKSCNAIYAQFIM